MKRIYGPGIKEMIERVHKRKVIKKIKGVYFLCEFPKFDKNRIPTDNELQARITFARGAKYAAEVIKDPETKKAYALKAKPWQSAYNLALKDCILTPKIISIKTNEYPNVFVRADDDFALTRVHVSIFS